MPRSYYRREVKFSDETNRLLEALRKEVSAKAGKKVSMNELLTAIVEEFLAKNPPEKGEALAFFR